MVGVNISKCYVVKLAKQVNVKLSNSWKVPRVPYFHGFQLLKFLTPSGPIFSHQGSLAALQLKLKFFAHLDLSKLQALNYVYVDHE